MNLLANQKYHTGIFLLILLFCIFLLFGRIFITDSAIGGDAVYYYSSVRSIAIDHDLDFKNEYEYFHQSISNFTSNRKIPQIPEENPITSKLPGKYPIGNAIFLLPPFLVTHFLMLLLQSLGLEVTADGYNLSYQSISALSSLIYAFTGFLFIYHLGKKLFGAKLSFLATVSIWLATPLIYYMTMEPLNSQPISFFCVSAFIYLWYMTRDKRKLNQWVMLGIVGGLMSIVRYQDSLFLLIPLIDSLRKLPSILPDLLSFFVSAGSIIAIQLGVNNYLFGSPLNTGIYESGFPYLASPKILYTLFSFERGLLVWSPILIFALVGLYWFAKRYKLIGSLLLLSLFLQVYVVSSWADPSQGDSFGNRILINSNVIFALGIMQFLKGTQIYQKLFLIIFTFLILMNGILAGLFIFRIIGQPY